MLAKEFDLYGRARYFIALSWPFSDYILTLVQGSSSSLVISPHDFVMLVLHIFVAVKRCSIILWVLYLCFGWRVLPFNLENNYSVDDLLSIFGCSCYLCSSMGCFCSWGEILVNIWFRRLVWYLIRLVSDLHYSVKWHGDIMIGQYHDWPWLWSVSIYLCGVCVCVCMYICLYIHLSL